LILKISSIEDPLSDLRIVRYEDRRGRREIKSYDARFDENFEVHGSADDAFAILTPKTRHLWVRHREYQLSMETRTLRARFPISLFTRAAELAHRMTPLFELAETLRAVAPEQRPARQFENSELEVDEAARLAQLQALFEFYPNSGEAERAKAAVRDRGDAEELRLLDLLSIDSSTGDREVAVRALDSESELLQLLALKTFQRLEPDSTPRRAIFDRVDALHPDLRIFGVWLVIRDLPPNDAPFESDDRPRIAQLREEHARFMAPFPAI
jgi:hypothetical protein